MIRSPVVELARTWREQIAAAPVAGCGLLLLRALEARGVVRTGYLDHRNPEAALTSAGQEFGPVFSAGDLGRLDGIAEYVDALRAPAITRALRDSPIAQLSYAYELAISGRKASGVYYTPPAIAARLVDQTVGRLIESGTEIDALTIVDPACGTGAFLLAAYEQIGKAIGRPPDPAMLSRCLRGVDIDAKALEHARFALALAVFERSGQWPTLAPEITRCGDALLGDVLAGERFHAVIGNPPWGQKGAIDADTKRAIRAAYPSCRGIFDWFRPFVELGVSLTRDRGAFGMVLPDIVLLKNYEPTRVLLLEKLALTEIAWLGMAFADATIDAVTIAGIKASAPAGHRVRAHVRDRQQPVEREIAQSDFSRNPRHTFNLFITPDDRAILDKLSSQTTLGEHFEAHEGVHSGNIRGELFVDSRLDDSCRELLFGRAELRPYRLEWAGRYLRLSAVPERRSRQRYANVGQPSWHERNKLVVRRTGDRITAAVDERGRYASNNFFVVLPLVGHPLSLHGLCALLNSAFMTWLFRAIEPRRGRAFAELKIKHLIDLPLPSSPELCGELNELGRHRSVAGGTDQLDSAIDDLVRRALGVSPPI